jgi:ubiquinone/menaquinone biosynthesis C-methylase UbiE
MSDRTRQRVDFGPLAEAYDALRPVDENWREVAEALVQTGELAGRRVLDIGCGTGRFAAHLAERFGAKAWGVDPSPEMLAVARRRAPRRVGFKVARAENLPFADGWFERAVMWLSAHLVDRPRAFSEVKRVLAPGGRLVIASFDPAHFDDYWMNRLFPSLESIDRARFPGPDALSGELRTAGFAPVRLVPLSQGATLAREDALRKLEGRSISTLQLLDENEYRTGIERARAELPERVEYALEWLLAVAER